VHTLNHLHRHLLIIMLATGALFTPAVLIMLHGERERRHHVNRLHAIQSGGCVMAA